MSDSYADAFAAMPTMDVAAAERAVQKRLAIEAACISELVVFAAAAGDDAAAARLRRMLDLVLEAAVVR